MIGKNKQRILITIEKKKLPELRRKAKSMGMTLSNLMVKAADDVSPCFWFSDKLDKNNK